MDEACDVVDEEKEREREREEEGREKEGGEGAVTDTSIGTDRSGTK